MPPATLLAVLGAYNLLPAIVFLPARRRCDQAASEAAFAARRNTMAGTTSGKSAKVGKEAAARRVAAKAARPRKSASKSRLPLRRSWHRIHRWLRRLEMQRS